MPIPKISLLLALAMMPGVAGRANAQSSPHVEPIYTRQASFMIPFSTVVTDASSQYEVQLYVSLDEGRSWHHYKSVAPAEGRFVFQAQGDGSYYFSTKTVAVGMPPALAAGEPELIVVVDTDMPRFDFHAVHALGSPVRIEWTASDQALAPDSLQVQYREPGGSWKSIAVESTSNATHPHQLGGSASWWPDRRDAPVEIRAEIKDRAGNSVVVSRRLGHNAEQDQEIARIPSSLSSSNAPHFQQPTLPLNQGWNGERENARNNQSHSENNPSNSENYVNNLALSEARGGWQPSAPRDTSTINPRVSAASIQSHPIEERPQASGLASIPQPAVEAHAASPATHSYSIPAMTGLPVGESVQMTSTRRFHLEYEIDTIGPAGVGTAELWGTMDGGRSWLNWGGDPDKKSPFLVEIEEEQVYGFKIVVESASGLSGELPQPGDMADVWVGVDLNAPLARITAARYGSGAETGLLKIEWQASDLYLAQGPITLLQSERPEGPWTLIATGLPNDGMYRWHVDPSAPSEVYLRLDVLDAAGNVGSAQLDRPIALSRLRPQAHIHNVRPLPEE